MALPSQTEGLEDFVQRQVFAVSENDHLVRLLPQFALNEPQQVLLVHAGAVMYVGVDLHK